MYALFYTHCCNSTESGSCYIHDMCNFVFFCNFVHLLYCLFCVFILSVCFSLVVCQFVCVSLLFFACMLFLLSSKAILVYIHFYELRRVYMYSI